MTQMPDEPVQMLQPSALPMYGAYDESGELVLAVEAMNVGQASVRLARVAQLLRTAPSQVMSIKKLGDLVVGVPTFYEAYFDELDDNMGSHQAPPANALQ